MFSVVNPRNENSSAPEIASGTDPARMMNGIAEALELRRQHQVDQDRREQERAEELAALDSQLARLTRVVDREALRQDRLGFVLEKA